MSPDARRSSFASIIDFASVRFRRKKGSSRKSKEDLYTHLNDSDWTLATVSSLKDETEKYDKYPAVDKEEEPETVEEGLYIRFAAKPPTRPLSENRLARLKYRIAKAVVAAGMECSAQAPSPETAQPFDTALKARPPRPRQFLLQRNVWAGHGSLHISWVGGLSVQSVRLSRRSVSRLIQLAAYPNTLLPTLQAHISARCSFRDTLTPAR